MQSLNDSQNPVNTLLSCTPAAQELIETLRQQHGDLMFHLSGGCCDGSAPMCFVVGDFQLGQRDVLLGDVATCPFYIAHDTLSYYQNMHIILDVVKGRGASFSLEIPLGVRFLIRSELIDA